MVLSDCGHPAGGPSGVVVQSSARMRAPNSPPPARKPMPAAWESLGRRAAVERSGVTDIETSQRVAEPQRPGQAWSSAWRPDRGGKIRVQARSDDSHAVIEVADNGSGITADLLPRVFDLFMQSDRTLDRAQGGLGIGLSIVKRLIEMHSGEVTAHMAWRRIASVRWLGVRCAPGQAGGSAGARAHRRRALERPVGNQLSAPSPICDWQ